MITIHDWFTLFDSMTCMQLYILCLIANICFPWSKPIHHSGTFFVSLVHCSLTLFHDSAFKITAQVCIHSFWSFVIHILILIRSWSFWVFIDLFINCHNCFILLVERPIFRDLEGCYGIYRTFPINNLTPKPDPIFHRPPFPK